MLLIQSMPQQGLDDSLATDVQLPCFFIKLLKHRLRKVNIHPLNRRHHLALVCEETRDVLSFIRDVRDLIGCW